MYGTRIEGPHFKEGSSRVLEGPHFKEGSSLLKGPWRSTKGPWLYFTLDIDSVKQMQQQLPDFKDISEESPPEL